MSDITVLTISNKMPCLADNPPYTLTFKEEFGGMGGQGVKMIIPVAYPVLGQVNLGRLHN